MMTWTRPLGGWWEWRLTGSSWFPSLLPVWLSSRGFLSSLSCCPQLHHVALCADLWGAFTELWLCPAVLLACYVTVTFNVFSKSEKLLHHRMQSFCLVCFVFALAAVSGVSLCICFLVFTRHPFAAVSKPLPLSHCRCFPYLPAFAFVAFCCLVVISHNWCAGRKCSRIVVEDHTEVWIQIPVLIQLMLQPQEMLFRICEALHAVVLLSCNLLVVDSLFLRLYNPSVLFSRNSFCWQRRN